MSTLKRGRSPDDRYRMYGSVLVPRSFKPAQEWQPPQVVNLVFKPDSLSVDIPPMRSHRSDAWEATVPNHGKPVAGARSSVGLAV